MAGSDERPPNLADTIRGAVVLLGSWLVGWSAAAFYVVPENQRALFILVLGIVALAPLVIVHRGTAPLAALAAIAALASLALKEAVEGGVNPATRLIFTVVLIAVTAGLADLLGRRILQVREQMFGQQRRIDDLVTLDSESGAFKQEWGESRLAEEVSRSRRLKQSFSVLIASVDNWESLLDERGRQAAIELLRGTTEALKSMQRTPDRIWRAGPGDLAMMLPDTDLDGAEVVAARTVARIQEKLGLVVIAGVAVFPEDGGDSLSLLGEARSAKDFAKIAGLPTASRRMLEM